MSIHQAIDIFRGVQGQRSSYHIDVTVTLKGPESVKHKVMAIMKDNEDGSIAPESVESEQASHR